MAKPDYAALFAQLEVETDPVIRAQLREQVYDFSPPYPLPEGETIDDYLLTAHEKELFAYTYDGYIVDNPGYSSASSSQLFVAPDYVLEGYINNIETDTSISSGFIAYVGEYYNSLGETT